MTWNNYRIWLSWSWCYKPSYQNIAWWGWAESLLMLQDLLSLSARRPGWMEETSGWGFFSAVLTTLCRTSYLGPYLELPTQTEQELVGTLFIVPLQKVMRIEEERCVLHIKHRNCRCCWACLTSDDVFSDHSTLSVICTPQKLDAADCLQLRSIGLIFAVLMRPITVVSSVYLMMWLEADAA